MSIFSEISHLGHEQVVFCQDPETQLKAIIAVHNTNLGPALGGVRFWHYQSEEQALEDVLRLSRAMTWKNALADLPLGGAKAVIMAPPNMNHPSEDLLRAYAKFVDRLNGCYLTAEDMGMTEQSMATIKSVTPHVGGLPDELGGLGDPSYFTARGVLAGMKAAAKHTWNDSSLKGKHIAIQGCGHVGSHLIEMLLELGARLTVTDYFAERTNKFKENPHIQVVEQEEIYSTPCDIFSPCAMGGILNPATIATLSAKVIAGCANNQLLDEQRDGALLQAKGITYAPDFLINAGGVIIIYAEIARKGRTWATQHIDSLYDKTIAVLSRSEKSNQSPALVALEMAQEKCGLIQAV